MNKFCYIFVGMILAVVVGLGLFYDKKPDLVSAEQIREITGSPVYAVIKNGGYLLDNYQNGKKQALYVAGATAEILKDRGEEWYYVAVKGQKGWIEGEYLYIPKDKDTNTDSLSSEEIEAYVNDRVFESDTDEFVWVDIDRQRVYILEGKNKEWRLIETFICSTGKNVSPTTRGMFKIGDRGEWFYSERLGSGAMNWVRFNESYLFHSVAMDKNKNIIDPVLGQRRSSGCVRMSVADSKWFFDNIKCNTLVYVN